KSTTSAPVDFKVDNNPSFPVTLAAAQVIPAPAALAGAAGTASLAVKLATGAVSGKVTLSGFTATGVTLNEAFAGNSGATLVTLTPSAGTAGEWDVPGSALLTSDQMTALLTGKLYVIASSAANPGGELRGQLTPANVTVIFAQLSGAQEVPAVNTNATGIAAVTVDANANTVTVHLHTSNASDATSAAVDTGAAGATGAQLVALAQDNVDPGHWSVELAAISTSDVGNFNANKWYLNVVTPADPKGAIRGQVDATSTPPPPAPTLTQLTTTVFQVCGGCHTGGGQSLPSSMDLTPGHIYASLVNVASVEVPSLDRVKPGDATNSYVVQKLAGTAAVGSRMPLGGPYLSQSDMDQLKAWISAGAANN
ncbi:MAG: CHRD domain-containing protein, partial [Gammaproteobacteria bacterium]|nr:CHRD domain-containing protein [Gammaproteobacteria bacterium]